jgi:hypothetical protein
MGEWGFSSADSYLTLAQDGDSIGRSLCQFMKQEIKLAYVQKKLFSLLTSELH